VRDPASKPGVTCSSNLDVHHWRTSPTVSFESRGFKSVAAAVSTTGIGRNWTRGSQLVSWPRRGASSMALMKICVSDQFADVMYCLPIVHHTTLMGSMLSRAPSALALASPTQKIPSPEMRA